MKNGQEQSILENLLLRLDRPNEELYLVTAEEIYNWPAGLLEALCRHGLLIASAPSTIFNCNQCSDPHSEEIIHVESPLGSEPRLYIQCPSVGRVMVDPESLKRWILVPEGWAKLVGRLLGLGGQSEPQIPGRIWRLGIASLGGVNREVLFTRGLSWEDGRSILDDIVNNQQPVPPAVFTPQELPNRSIPCQVMLNRVLRFADGNISFDKNSLGHVFELWAKESMIAAADDVQPFVFQRQGDFWRLRFEGHESIVKHSRGLEQISYLLSKPELDISVFELVQLGIITDSKLDISYEQLEADVLSVSGPGDSGEMLDAKARQEYKKRLDAIEEELADAEEYGYVDRAEELRSEKDVIIQQLKAGTGLGGRSRKTGSPAERARIAVGSSIRRAIKTVSKHDPKLGQFLDNSIKTGITCKYSPDKNISWLLS